MNREIKITINRRESNRRYSAKLKMKVLSHYSNNNVVCSICGESRIECLSIDHTSGGGNNHRKAIGTLGGSFYRWLVKNNFPQGYQVLCMNCQWCKRKKDMDTYLVRRDWEKLSGARS